MYRVYFEVSFAYKCGKRSAPARDFGTNETAEAADVSRILQDFRCEQLGQKIRPARVFAAGETKETEDVSGILRGFLCAQMR